MKSVCTVNSLLNRTILLTVFFKLPVLSIMVFTSVTTVWKMQMLKHKVRTDSYQFIVIIIISSIRVCYISNMILKN